MNEEAVGEELLTGGNSSVVSRVGETVRRTAGPWTPRVHELLGTLRAAGITEVPEPLGLDERGREMLSFVPGCAANYPLPAWLWQPHLLVESAQLLRRVHDASVPLIAHCDGWQSPVHEPVEVICHNDAAPYNYVFMNGHVSGLIDFDTASPGPRIWDLAYLAYRLVPFVADAGDEAPPAQARFARLAALIRGYGSVNDTLFEPAGVLRVMSTRLDDLAQYSEQRAADTGRQEFLSHAAMYRGDAARVLALAASEALPDSL